MIDHEAAVRAATEQLVAAILAAVKAEAATGADAPDRLLSVDQAADLIGLGRSATYGELGAGRLRSVKVGRRRLVPAGAVADFIRTTEAATVVLRSPSRLGRDALRADSASGSVR